MDESKLHIEDVYKSYDGKVILDDIDLKVSKGEFCSVVGPSGCGKSTLLRLILGQEFPERGRIAIDGEPVGTPDTHRGIVFQRYSLFPNRTVLDNVLLGKKFQRGQWWNPFHRNQDDIDEAMSFLKKVRLENAADKYPHELSGGMQQRAAIAQALIMKPPVLLMDEPFGALDPDTRDELQVFLLELWEQQELTVFFVTHDLTEACFLGSRLLVLSQYYTDDRGLDAPGRGGRIVADYPLPSVANSLEIKDDPAFQRLISDVRNAGFDPRVRQHVSEFNLTHSDSFQTVLPDEYSQGTGIRIR
ncbi:MAG: ABC transporter ATP-binding protein [Pseudomonadota bacterium]|nr:ABC transporter ATP-binding protein [Pseudomonadota bacterium]MEC8104577.1 ABC transporter ATP-binding protein [Pseudomonadota bacterium]MEC8525438.1 ABC transporter ATP-binding protein [Pseudomonadota bacterium]